MTDKTEEALRRTTQIHSDLGLPFDEQQRLVYKWESHWNIVSNQCDWTLDQCKRFVSHVWKAYFGSNAKPPQVASGRGQVLAGGGRSEITLPLWARNRSIILHELAHGILEQAYGSCYNHEGHGPEFVRMEIELFIEYSAYTRTTLLRTAREMGVKVAPKSSVPKRLRKGKSQKLDAWMRRGSESK